ncbi:MAG: hypothetical protein H6741_23645 [Alphaproteobacteria bacterium]|nr:hypothetical protein [Alphaproteobacteria bacterium]MCB9795702.1 hypothetical protein [Alphaproteobacteria bacterium]
MILSLLLACSTPPVSPVYAQPYPETLSAWGLFKGPVSRLDPKPGVQPYALTSPLFTDYADKYRFAWVPEGSQVGFTEQGPLDFPVGAVLSKTFAYRTGAEAPPVGAVGAGARLVETRLLVHTPEGWVGLPYVWNAEQTDATLSLAGDILPMDVPVPGEGSVSIQYAVPNANQCKGCHETQKDRMSPIGPTFTRLNRARPGSEENQLLSWAVQGFLSLPEARAEAAPVGVAYEDPSASLYARARAYLDVHCAHCHSPGGPADTSGLYLGESVSELHALGRCKAPVAAGRASGGLLYDIVPGQPDASILVRRLASEDPETMMPEVGRALAHREGVALIRAWVEAMEGDCEAPTAEASP